MSETEHYTCKLVPIDLVDGSLEKTMESILSKNGIDVDYQFDIDYGLKEIFCDSFYNEYLIEEGILYQVTDKKSHEDEDVYEAHRNKDGTIDLHLKYYNGGCSFSEAAEEALGK